MNYKNRLEYGVIVKEQIREGIVMIKNIIFDLGNVIINYNQKNIINSFTTDEEETDYIIKEIFNSPEWQLMDLGNITNNEAGDRINKRNNYKYEELTNNFLQNWYKVQTINKEVVDLAKKLHSKGYKLYVLSNMANLTFNYFKSNEFFALCEGIVISAQEHIKKPDEKVFNILLQRYNLKSEEWLFIDDDDTGKSYKTANEMGILGRVVIPNDVEDIKQMLNEFKIEL